MKVFIVTDYFWPSIGGLENFITYLAECLQRRTPVEVFTTTENHGKELEATYIIKRFISSGNMVYKEMLGHIEKEEGAFSVCFMGFSESWMDELLEFMQYLKSRFNCDILFKIPSVKSFPYFIHSEERLKKFMCADHIICLNELIKKELLQKPIPDHKIVSLQNGIPSHHFMPATAEAKNAIRSQLGIDEKLTFIFTGRFTIVKRVDLLVEAFSRIESANLILVGYFDKRFNKDYSFSIPRSNIRIRRFEPTSNILTFLQAADVYISASSSEGMSISLLEAMSCGLPSLVSNIKGHRAVTHDENGRLFEAGNLEDLLEGILWFTRHQEKYSVFSQKARHTILSNYSIDSIAEAYFGLMSNRIQQNNR